MTARFRALLLRFCYGRRGPVERPRGDVLRRPDRDRVGRDDGLRSIRERAAVIGGRLTVRSEPDAGTEVELRVPGAIAYAISLQQGPFQSTTS